MNQWNLKHSEIQSFKNFSKSFVYQWLVDRLLQRTKAAINEAQNETTSLIEQSKALGRARELDSLLTEIDQMIEICLNLEEKEDE